jgi:hypothetical protein
MIPIATRLVDSNTSAVNFANIPTTYKHLQARIVGRGTVSFGGGLSVYMGFTGLSTSATRRHNLLGNGSSVLSSSDSGNGILGAVADGGAPADFFSSTIIDILDWQGAGKNITIHAISGYDTNGGGIVSSPSGLAVRSSGSATGIDFTTDGNWVAGSRFTLYGLVG